MHNKYSLFGDIICILYHSFQNALTTPHPSHKRYHPNLPKLGRQPPSLPSQKVVDNILNIISIFILSTFPELFIPFHTPVPILEIIIQILSPCAQPSSFRLDDMPSPTMKLSQCRMVGEAHQAAIGCEAHPAALSCVVNDTRIHGRPIALKPLRPNGFRIFGEFPK